MDFEATNKELFILRICPRFNLRAFFAPLYVFSLMLGVGDGIKDLFVGGKIK